MDLVIDFLITKSVRLTDNVLKINYRFSNYPQSSEKVGEVVLYPLEVSNLKK